MTDYQIEGYKNMSKPIILCACGKARHGKNTFADLLKEQSEKNILQIAYADYLKYVARKYFGWDGQKDEKGRTLLQQLGTEEARTNNPDIWVDTVIGLVKAIGYRYDYIITTDCRFPNEINRWKEDGFTVFAIHVERLGFKNKLTEEQKNHASENALNDFNFDYYIEAYNIEGLKDEIDCFRRVFLNE
jgi:hypothetical protein